MFFAASIQVKEPDQPLAILFKSVEDLNFCRDVGVPSTLFTWPNRCRRRVNPALTESKPASPRLILRHTLGGVCPRCDLIIHF
jgi:hypothetical protein